MTRSAVVAIDQGTSSTRAIAFDPAWRVIATAARPLTVRHPRPGWAEQDPAAILASVVEVVAEVLATLGTSTRIDAVGLANQGETVVAWDGRTGCPLAPAVLWQCRRSEGIVDGLRAAGLEPAIRDRTGLPLDSYFSAGKMRWLLDHVPAVREAAAAGTLRLGTVDAWITSSLGDRARTDPSTASRTQLFGSSSLAWEDDLLAWFGVPRAALPEVGPSAGDLGTLHHPSWDRPLPLRSSLCDQQAALAGHGCTAPGSIKATYGTGVFVLANAGPTPPPPVEGILGTVAWTIGAGATAYALDGGVFSGGSLLTWLRAELGIGTQPGGIGALAASITDSAGVRVLPALSGLGAPWWDPHARAVIAGLSGGATTAHIARAALDGIAQRVVDVVDAMLPALPRLPGSIRVDGGISAEAFLMQRQADLLGIPLEVAHQAETTALGVAWMAAQAAGLDRGWDIGDRGVARHVEPAIGDDERRRTRDEWRAFVHGAAALEGQPRGAHGGPTATERKEQVG